MDTETRSEAEIEETTERLLEDLRDVVRDGEALLQQGADQLGEKGREARARLAEALEKARETGRKLQERAVAGTRAADRVIRENPYQAIGIAFGVGLLFGVLINRNK